MVLSPAGINVHKIQTSSDRTRDFKCCRFGVAFGALVSLALLFNDGRLVSVLNAQRDHLLQLAMLTAYSGIPVFISNASNNVSTSNSTGQSCDLSRGSWVPYSKPPLYTNETCKYIHSSQNCMKNGRLDHGYLKWNWQPKECELPDFDPHLFFELMKGKIMMFIGDSIARNHEQSLLCALSQVEEPQNIYFNLNEKEATWVFPSYNFTLANVWSPFLVQHKLEDDIYSLYLDKPEKVWSLPLARCDFAIISTGYWFFRPSVYYHNNTLLGVNARSGLNLTTVDILRAMEIAWDAVLSFMVETFEGMVILRTITVPHFESGKWSSGGNCNKTEPLSDPEMKQELPWMNVAIRRLQINALTKAAQQSGAEFKATQPRLKLLDVSYSSLLRPDGHPGGYRIQNPGEPRNDCLHWCLPGPIDTWNQLLLFQILKT